MKTQFSLSLSLAVLIGIVSSGRLVRGQSEDQYNVLDLGAALGTNSAAQGINNNGQVVGYWDTGTNGIHAFLYSQGVLTDIGALGETPIYALSVNSLGHVVGFHTISNGIRAFVYGGTVTNLGNWGGRNSYAFGINSAGRMVGHIDTVTGARAVIYDRGSVTNLGTLGGTNSYAFSVNASNQVAGASLVEDDLALNAFIWQDGTITNLNDLIPANSGWVLCDARGINEKGGIVGWGITSGVERAFLFIQGGIIDLGVLAGGTNSYALGLNNSNHVVGASSVAGGGLRAFLWKNGQLLNLNGLINPNRNLVLREARGINDGGQIAGWGVIDGKEHAVLLTPNAPPVITLNAPPAGGVFSSPTNLVLEATASDDGTVIKVEFYASSNKLGEALTSPFAVTWENVLGGNYSLTAVATDDLGATATSAVVVVTVTLPEPDSLKLWLKADSLTDMTEGALIQTWSDSSGHGSHATQSTVASRPAYVASGLNGFPAVRFDATNDFFSFQNNPLTGATQAEVFAVVKARVDAPSGNRSLYYLGSATYYPHISGALQDGFVSSVTQNLGDPAQPLDQFHLYNAASQAGDWSARLNGVLRYQTTNNTVLVTTTPNLGRHAGGSSYFDGDLAEMLIYNRTLTDGEREAVGSYLTRKYALISAPAAPAILTANAISSNQVSLSWTAGLTSQATKFVVERKQGAGGTYAVIAEVENAASCLDTSVVAAVQYFYRVTARNYGGQSLPSNEAEATTAAGVAGMPLTELTLWLEGDAGHGAGPVAFWADQSGRGNHAVQPTTGAQPQAIPLALNGRPAVRFDGTNDFLSFQNNPLTGATQAEVFAVVKARVGVPSGNRSLYYLGSATYYPHISGSLQDGFVSSVTQNLGDPAQPLDQFHLYNAASQPGEWSARLNGVLQYQTTNNTVLVTTTPNLGRHAGGSSYFDGDLTELLIYNRTLTDGEREAVGSYLTRKYALMSAPAAPANLTANAISSNQVSLSWTAGLTNQATKFVVERKQGAGGTYAVIAEVENAASCLDTSAVAAVQYFYRVTARNYGGQSLPSNEAEATTAAGVAGMPLNDLTLWLEGDAGHGAGLVAFWADQSGRGNHAVQPTTGAQPQTIPLALNGRPAVRFDATNDFFSFQNNPLTGATQAEVFAVVKARVDMPGGNRSLYYLGSATYYPHISGSLQDGFVSSVTQNLGDPAQPLDQFHLYNAASQPGEWSARLNGVLQYQTTNNTVLVTTTPNLGRHAGGSSYFDGDLAELLIYNRVLETAERTAVERYLNGKYSITDLPSPPTDLIAMATSPIQVNLSWSNVTAQANIEIERKSGVGGTYSLITTVGPAVTNYSDTGLASGQEYFYRVRASNLAGTSSYSSEVSAIANTPPSAALLHPTNGAMFVRPLNLDLIATASDIDGTIVKVAFFHGGTIKIGEAVTNPFGVTWSNVPPGMHSLTAKATDNFGGTATSPSVSIIVSNAAPSVMLTTPPNDSVYQSPATIQLDAAASDADGTVTKVEFFHGGTNKIGEDAFSPFSVTWSNVTAGVYSLTAIASDDSGAGAVSPPVTVTVNAQPSISITAPTNNARFPAPANLTITATAIDPDGSISGVEFYEGFNRIGSDSSAPFSLAWSNVAAGIYRLTAVVIDNTGATATSGPISVSITTNLVAFEDAHVRGGNKSSVNYGSANPIEVQTDNTAANNRDAYFKFNLGGVSNISGARFRFSAKLSAAGTVGTTIHATGTNWAESTITWNTRPALGTNLSSAAINTTTNAWYELEVTSHVLAQTLAGSNVISFVLHDSANSSQTVRINSREAATDQPQLALAVTNYYPTVAIMAPSSGSLFSPGSAVGISANASSPGGVVTQVVLFAGIAEIGADTATPFFIVWSNVASGAHALTARATDTRGLTATSSVVNVTVDAAPTVALTSPVNGAGFTAPANITLTAAASDSDGTISLVEFFQGTTSLGARTSAPFSLTWSNVSGSSYALSARATDNLGMTSPSAVVNVIVNDPPSITVQPQSQTSVQGGSTSFNITATGTPPLTYQWRFNGTNLPGQTGAALVLQNLQSSNAGQYSVVVANSYGSVTSAPASLALSIIVGWGTNQNSQISVYPWMTNNIVAVAAGDFHNAALRSDGTVLTWGGQGAGFNIIPPSGLANAVAVSCGRFHTLALTSDGRAVGWGDNSAGQINAPAGLSNAVAVCAGGQHSLALRADGKVVAWGDNFYGQTTVPNGLSNVMAISAGTFTSMALRSNGTVVVWGGSCCGVTNVPGGLNDAVAISAGNDFCLALRGNGTVLGWGYNGNGQTDVPSAAFNVTAIAAGSYHSAALRGDGTVVAWGGQDDPFNPADPPYAGQANVPAGLARVISIGAGELHTTALLTNDANLRPFVTITSPANNTTNSGPTNVTIIAGAKDWDGSVAKVDFYVNGSLIGTDTTSPYSIIWSNAPLGVFSLTARATDNLGAGRVSLPVILRLNTSAGILGDAHVFDGSPGSNFGTATNLEVRTGSAGNNRDAYFKFDLSNFTGVTGARLRFNARLSGSGSVGVSAYAVTNTAWGETTITWSNRPTLNNALSGATVTGNTLAWYELDVTSHVLAEQAAGRNVLSLGLHATTTSTRIIQINSREAPANRPVLILSSTNTEPTVSLIDPPDAAVFAAPANITVTANASDADGSIRRVEFFHDASSVGVRTSSPFSLVWSNVATGTYALTARATDNVGTVKTSAVVTVYVDIPPSVSLISPTNGTRFIEPANIAMAATAFDLDGEVSKVEFYAGTNRVAEVTNSPYLATWLSAPAGSSSLTARATDDLGVATVSPPIHIIVYPTPTNAAFTRLGYWRFDDTNWLGDQGQTPLAATNIQSVSGIMGHALQLNSASPAILQYHEVEASRAGNIDIRNGTVVFWFKPGWSSTNFGGAGPGALGHLLSLGQLTADASIGCWTLSVNAEGTALSFITQTNGRGTTNFTTAISWPSNEWHQIGLVYTPSNSALYIDAQPAVTGGPGVTLYPDAVTRAAEGFSIGSDGNGLAQAKGQFDALETFNYPLTALAISERPDSDGDGLPDRWENQFGLDPNSAAGNDGGNGDPDGDGLLNLEEWVFETNPQVNDLPGGRSRAIQIHTPLE